MRQQITAAIQVIVQMDRLQGGLRKVTSISEAMGMEEEAITMQEIYRFTQQGVDPMGRAYGQFEATGIRPHFSPRLKAAGIDLAPALFQKRVLLRG
jgi:pilus assembly protein CpaF